MKNELGKSGYPISGGRSSNTIFVANLDRFPGILLQVENTCNSGWKIYLAS